MAAERGTVAKNGGGAGRSGTSSRKSAPPEVAPGVESESGSGLTAAAPWISLVARLALGAVWLYYSLPKLGSTEVDSAAVRNFQILPSGLVDTFAYAQPYVELALGLLIIAGLGTRLVAAFSALLLLVYIGGIASLGARGIHITCGCGGAGSTVAAGHTRYTLDILRDIAFLVPAAWLLWKPESKYSADGALVPPPVAAPSLPTPRRATVGKGGAASRS
jgi:uncharacterized membrane protein YphA (DoxX/SURF4 family)